LLQFFSSSFFLSHGTLHTACACEAEGGGSSTKKFKINKLDSILLKQKKTSIVWVSFEKHEMAVQFFPFFFASSLLP